jgi:heme exporter protein D
MIIETILMNGYGLYVWSAFAFTIMSFVSLYILTKIQYTKEKNKFIAKFGTLNSERAAFARSQSINKEILSNVSNF